MKHQWMLRWLTERKVEGSVDAKMQVEGSVGAKMPAEHEDEVLVVAKMASKA